MKYPKHILVLLFIFSSFLLKLTAQNSQVIFGKNRIQTKNFKWEYLSTNNFDIYFYYGGRESAIYAAKYIETDYKALCRSLGLSNYRHVKLLVYNTPKDLLMSNLEFTEPDPALGSSANFVKSKAEVCFEGNHEKFRNELKKEIARFLINESIYGGNIKTIIKNSYLMNIPDWYVSGLSYYIGYGYTEEMDNYVRSMAQTGKLKNPNVLIGKDAEMYGASVWNFIGNKYGSSNVANVLQLTQDTRNPKDAISMVLGMSFSQFIKNWKEYYKKMSFDVEENYIMPDKKLIISKRNRKGKRYSNLKISTTGEYVTYTSNYKGRYKVIVYDINKKSRKVIYRGGYKVYTQTPDETMPLVTLFADKIGVVDFIKDKFYLKTYSKKGKLDQKIELPQFENILGVDFSEDGNALIISGQMNGESDLWYMNFKDNTYRQLTLDYQDDLEPAFLKGSSQSFVFVSNRMKDTLTPTRIYADKVKIKDYYENTDLYLFENTKGVTKLKKLTNTPDKEYLPQPWVDNSINYLADYNGIKQIYNLNLKTGLSVPITNFLTSVKNYNFLPRTTMGTFISMKKNREHVYFDPEFTVKPNEKTPLNTERKNLIDQKIQEKIAFEEYVKYVKDSLDNQIDINDLSFNSNEDPVDIENYQFELEKDSVTETTTKTKLPEDLIKLNGPTKYKHTLGITSLTNSFLLDNLNGSGISQSVGFTDILGNHKITGNFTYFSNLRSSNSFIEYQYLKRRLDFTFKFTKNRFYVTDLVQIAQKTGLNAFETKISYPITPTTRISITPHVTNQYFNQLNPNFVNADLNNFFVGSHVDLNRDNSEITGANMRNGVRFRALLEHYLVVNAAAKSFSRFDIDFRWYQPIINNLVFAFRGAGGKFFDASGNKYFMLGGSDGLVGNNRHYQQGEKNPFTTAISDLENGNPDIMFDKFVTNVRGYQLNTVYGQNYFLLNAEIRVPIAKFLFAQEAINSIFVRNLQFFYFGDMGAAWTGNDPFSRNNTFSKTSYNSPPFTGYSITYATPVLSSYGFGFRSYVLGYYVKLDFVNPVRDFVVSPKKVILSLGHDF